MVTKIGIISGQILSALEQERRTLSVKELAETLQESLDDIHLSLGWLVREKYIRVETIRNECWVTLGNQVDVVGFRNRLLAYQDELAQQDKKRGKFVKADQSPEPQPELSQKFYELIERLRCGVYTANAQGVLTYVNKYFLDILGYKVKSEVIGKNLSQELQISPADFHALVRQLDDKGEVQDYELKYVRADGKVVILAETLRAVKDAMGRLVGIEGFIRDVTERKHREELDRVERLKLEHILSLQEEISSIMKLEDLVDFVVTKAVDILDVHRCSLMLLDKDRNELSIKAAVGINEDIIQQTRVKLGEQVSGVVAMYGEPMMISDMDVESPLPRKNRPSYQGRSFMSVPIKLEKKVIGVVNVTHKGKNKSEVFNQTDLRVLSAIIRQTAVAIENAELYRELRYLSITDPLTGLFNHRHFTKSLEQEIKRVRRYPAPLCLLMIDVDHFKTYNDTLGHLVGDRILKEVSQVIRKNLREIDVACRYGGDEFAVILVETRVHKAEIVAKKFLKAVEQLQLEKPITLSIGLAAFSEGMDRHDLILKADRALYESKKAGRNRFSVYA